MHENHIKMKITRSWEDLNGVFTALFSHCFIDCLATGLLDHDLSSYLGFGSFMDVEMYLVYCYSSVSLSISLLAEVSEVFCDPLGQTATNESSQCAIVLKYLFRSLE